jgi:hypothetical protein
MPTPQEMLDRCAKVLCPGDDYQAQFAKLVGVRRDTVRMWVHGRLPLRADHFETVLRLITERQAEIAKIEAELMVWLASQPLDPP